MKKNIKTWIFPVISALLTLVSALFWVALRINYSGISKFLGADTNQSFLIMNLPVMVCGLAWLGFVIAFLGLLRWKKKKWPAILGFAIGIIVTVGAVVVVRFGAKDYLRFISVHFWKSMAVAGCIVLFGLLLFFPGKPTPRNRALKAALLALVVVMAVVLGYQLRPCRFTYGAVVYAVEDDYQIVFSTSDSAMAWVEIGGERYYDLYAGSMKSIDKVHKVEVPQTVLDAAGGYTVCAKQMIYRGPFGGYTGETISQDYAFRPVDPSDGIYHHALSDVHEAVAAAAASTEYDLGQEMDFLILLGDLVSMVETEKDAQLANELAHAVTGGEIPVIYARGNHEIKGEYSEDLHKYVGSRNGNYYYPVTLSGTVFAVVLDIGEDHEDDWWEYYGTSQFTLYRRDQTRMLEELLAEEAYASYPYRMALCHIPVTHVDAKGYFEEDRHLWTDLLNQMEMDISLSGHEHELLQFLPGTLVPGETLVYSSGYTGGAEKEEGGYMTDAHFPAFLAGRRSLQQQGGTQKDGMTDYVGFATRVELDLNRQVSNYINSRGEIITGYYPFVGSFTNDTFSDIVTDLQ